MQSFQLQTVVQAELLTVITVVTVLLLDIDCDTVDHEFWIMRLWPESVASMSMSQHANQESAPD